MKLNDYAERQPRHHQLKLPVDEWIPFVPSFAIFYFSAYLLGALAYPMLIFNNGFMPTMWGYLLLVTTGLFCYYFFPCKVIRKENLIPKSASEKLLLLFQKQSKPYNSFPSMHTAFCLFSVLSINHFLDLYFGFVLFIWAFVVILSTLLTKQHYILDVLAGVIISTVAFILIK